MHREGEVIKEKKTLTLSLGDGGGGGDGAKGGAAWEGRVGPSHGHRVADPRCWVDGSDRFIWRKRKALRDTDITSIVKNDEGIKKPDAGSLELTAWQSEVALRRRVPALGHCEDDGSAKQKKRNH